VSKGRLEAFSDGVIAILITIMVFELRVPHGSDWSALAPVMPVFFAYILSFVFLGIYWNNHDHMLHATTQINGAVLRANLHLLFWLSLTLFVTGWMGENEFAPLPTTLYGVVLLLSAIAYTILLRTILAIEGPQSTLAKAVGRDRKGHAFLLLYAIAIRTAFVDRFSETASIVKSPFSFVAVLRQSSGVPAAEQALPHSRARAGATANWDERRAFFVLILGTSKRLKVAHGFGSARSLHPSLRALCGEFVVAGA